MHLPYWAIFLGTAISIRALVLPMQVNTIKVQPKMVQMREAMKGLDKNDPEIREKMMKLRQEFQVSPFAAFKPLSTMIALGGTSFFAIRRLLVHSADELKTDGLLWFPDLLTPDPTMILP